MFKNEVKNIIGVVLKPMLNLFRINTGNLSVFNYHDVTKNPSEFEKEFNLFVTPDVFEKQIVWIKNNFNIIHPEDIMDGNKIPRRAAIITFDDGFLGAFKSGLEILRNHNITPVMFLNMYTIQESVPMLSALVCYMDRHIENFRNLAKREGLNQPYYLSMTPNALKSIKKNLPSIDYRAVIDYQGVLVSSEEINKWSSKYVVYGNHLYDHWNCKALTNSELIEQYSSNEKALSNLKNSIKFFAFTNGQPGTCFTSKDIATIKNMGAKKIFTTFGGVNRNCDYSVLGRVSFTNDDGKDGLLWYRLARSILSELKGPRKAL